jgi:hypothetical protein
MTLAMRRRCALAAVLALAACGGQTPTPRPSDGAIAATDSAALAVEAEGLRLFNRQSGSARPIAFGTARDDVLKMLAFRGKAETGQNAECGAGTLDFANWADGLGLYFQQDKFVGWHLNPRSDRAITTASGIGVGSSRAELEAVYAATISETSLGTEFAAGELFGLLDGKGPMAKITHMWGGVSCNFR